MVTTHIHGAEQTVLSAMKKIRQKLTTSPLEYGTRFKYYQDLYKLRIGDYRVIYKVDTERQKVFILVIGNRNKIYEILRKRLG
ncbi:MAG TPA: type II toxin-antitoxin system RelE family toxin [Candidatus Hypogeohydataceae bacterium YC40]